MASNASVNDSYDSPSLTVVNGNPAVLYHSRVNDDAAYKRGTDANGTAFSSEVTVKTGPDFADSNAMIFFGGLPLAAYHDSGNDDIVVSYGSNANGSAWDASLLLEGATTSAGDGVEMIVVDSKPALVYEHNNGVNYNLHFARLF